MPARPERLLLSGGRLLAVELAALSSAALLVEGDRIVWIGDAADAPAADRRIDLGGAVVIPGLTDAHIHLFAIAEDRLQVPLEDPAIDSIDKAVAHLARAARQIPADEWVIGSGYNEFNFAEKRAPNRDELDRVAPGRPVLIRRVGGHFAVANSAALEAAGVSESTPDPEGGRFERVDGRLTGALSELAADFVYARAPRPTVARLAATIREIAAEYLALGVTAAVEAAVGFTAGFTPEWEVWRHLQRSGGFPLRMGFMLRIGAEEAAAADLSPGPVDLDWQVRTLKFFADGIFGARTAALSQPYHDCPGSGFLMRPSADLERDFVSAHKAGWQIAAHAVGDHAIDTVMSAYRTAQRALPRRDARHRVEHLALPSAAAIAALQDTHTLVVTQYGFLRNLGDGFAAALGPERVQRVYPGRMLLDAGITVCGSSDGPIGPPSPFIGMAAAIDRRTKGGLVIGAEQSLSAAEALRLYAGFGAYAMFHEHQRGDLRPGMLADLAVIDADPLTATPGEIGAIRSHLTMVRGRIVYGEGAAA
jgi:predicted amidohydrolase YtcJ